MESKIESMRDLVEKCGGSYAEAYAAIRSVTYIHGFGMSDLRHQREEMKALEWLEDEALRLGEIEKTVTSEEIDEKLVDILVEAGYPRSEAVETVEG